MKKALIGFIALTFVSTTAVYATGDRKKAKKARTQATCCTKTCPPTMGCCNTAKCPPLKAENKQ